ALSTSNTSVTGNLSRTTGPGSPTTDATLDFTTASGNGQLAAGSYTWTGYVYVPTTDTYTFRFQFSPSVSSSNVTFSLDGTAKTLAAASTFYHGQYQGTVVVNPTNGGYTEKGLTNQQVAAASVTAGYHLVTITFNNTTAGTASFRFAYSRAVGDLADAAAAAVGKRLAIVFVNDDGVAAASGPTSQVQGLGTGYVTLINAVATAN